MTRAFDFTNPTTGEMDLSKPGNLGVLTDIANINNQTPYIKNPMQIRLTRAPRAFQNFNDGEVHTRFLKQLVETRCKNWTGFSTDFSIVKHATPNGNDNQQLNTVTDTQNNQVTPSGTWDSMYDAVDVRWWRWFVKALYADPTLKRPNFGEFDTQPTDWAHDQNTFDVMVWEPNATFTKPVHAMVFAHMSLTDIPPVLMERNPANARIGEEYTLTFDGVWSDSDPVYEMAQAIMDAENQQSINQRRRPLHFKEIQAEVTAAAGYNTDLNKAKAWV